MGKIMILIKLIDKEKKYRQWNKNEVIAMHHLRLAGYSYKHISEMMGVFGNSVKCQILAYRKGLNK